MPAGSNPSYLDTEQYDALQQAFPSSPALVRRPRRPASASTQRQRLGWNP